MLKYIFTLGTLLDSKSINNKRYNLDTVISDLVDKDLDEIDWILTLSELELVYGFEIPDTLYDRTDLTLEQFADELAQLPLISEKLYPEFFDIKLTSMKLTRRYIELEDKTDAESVREKNEINRQFELLNDRLNVLLGNILVN